MQAIADWLKSGTYEQGVALYERHGSNTFLKQKFRSGANDYNVAKLREEMVRLAPLSQESRVKSQEGLAVAKIHPPMTFGPTPESAKKYLQLTNHRDKLYRTLNMLMEQKFHLPEGEDLRICCVGILTTHQKIVETWALIDHYTEHGSFPPEATLTIKPPIAPKKEMQLLRQTISKAKKRLLSPGCRDKEQTQTLLDTSTSRLALLVAAKRKKA